MNKAKTTQFLKNIQSFILLLSVFFSATLLMCHHHYSCHYDIFKCSSQKSKSGQYVSDSLLPL